MPSDDAVHTHTHILPFDETELNEANVPASTTSPLE